MYSDGRIPKLAVHEGPDIDRQRCELRQRVSVVAEGSDYLWQVSPCRSLTLPIWCSKTYTHRRSARYIPDIISVNSVVKRHELKCART